jgi:hypothetical protein
MLTEILAKKRCKLRLAEQNMRVTCVVPRQGNVSVNSLVLRRCSCECALYRAKLSSGVEWS